MSNVYTDGCLFDFPTRARCVIFSHRKSHYIRWFYVNEYAVQHYFSTFQSLQEGLKVIG